MLLVVITLALLAALFNAISAVLQRRASSNVSAKELFKGGFMLEVSKSKLWLMGFGMQILAFIAQAGALRDGSLVVVEPLLTADVIFLLLILRYRFRVAAGRREWLGVAGVCVGLSGLLIAANPRNGHLTFYGLNWAITSASIALLLIISALVTRHQGSPKLRAALAGVAAGASFALTSAFTKLVVAQLHQGFFALLTAWEVYALIVSGIMSILMMQSAYSAGPLATSQPAVEIVDPAVSTVIGIVLFGDVVNHSVTALIIETVCAILLGAGVIALGGSPKVLSAGKKGF